MKAKLFSLCLFLMVGVNALACPVCEKQQPKLLRGITHGVPQSDWDWVIVGIVLAIALYTLYRSVKLLIWPGEREGNHIKQSILQAL